MLQLPGSSSSVEKKKKKASEDKPKAQTSKPLKSSLEKPSKLSDNKSSRSVADARIDELDQKWSDRFYRLEALLLARTLDKPEPTFYTVKVTPMHALIVCSMKATKAFIRSSNRPEQAND